MRLVTLRTERGTTAARLDGGTATEIDAVSVSTLLLDPAWRQRAERAGGATHRADTIDLAPLVPTPAKIICVGRNYVDHVNEVGSVETPHPALFAKFARTLIGAHDRIVLPVASGAVDWEAELGVVIGSPARHVSAADAMAHVAGYTVVNDISMRDWQSRTTQAMQGKIFEASTPIGPALVTLDELPDHAAGLEVRCEVNGVVMQRALTSTMIFGVAELIAYCSTIITLDPGDVISTGTPAGVGTARKPPIYLRDGDTVTTVVEGVGELRNVCVAEAGAG